MSDEKMSEKVIDLMTELKKSLATPKKMSEARLEELEQRVEKARSSLPSSLKETLPDGDVRLLDEACREIRRAWREVEELKEKEA